MASFELFIALRYLRAKRKQAVISVITIISVIGVAMGVMALIIALGINNGFRNTLQRTLLGATAHVTVMERNPGTGISNYREVIETVRKLPHVESAAPTLYGSVFLQGGMQGSLGILKGIDLTAGAPRADLQRNLKAGSIELLANNDRPSLILGSRLAQTLGVRVGDMMKVVSPQGELTPYGQRPAYFDFRVAGIFESGFFDLDSAWGFMSIHQMQRVLSLGNVVNAVEVKVSPVDEAVNVAKAAEGVLGQDLAATHWMEQNRNILNALKMERFVTIITIGLIQLVAALNILISLVMMVMEKYRDIAVLLSMGATREQIRRIFLMQGLLIGGSGTIIGLILGYGISFAADHWQLIQLDEQVYALSHVPFEPRWLDAIWVAGTAMVVSVLATIYPARNATRILPAEALRYE